jgi:hypothetical protein
MGMGRGVKDARGCPNLPGIDGAMPSSTQSNAISPSEELNQIKPN